MSRPKSPSHSAPAGTADSQQPFAARLGRKNRLPGENAGLSPGLYVTATPIGNASDVTLRALAVLGGCDAIVAEDTRVTSRLLAIHGISRPMLPYNDHNAPAMRPKLLQRLREGARLALVSDAGTPLISDPGHKLVRAAIAEGVSVYPIPGPSAVLAALSASGLPTDRFLFAGFLPAKRGERRSEIAELRTVPSTLIFFESPNRLPESLSDLAEILGNRQAVVARELTKLHEEIRRGSLKELAASYAGAAPKGEVTLVVAPPEVDEPNIVRTSAAMDGLLAQALAYMPVSAASALIAEAMGVPRRAVYQRALKLKKAGQGGGDEP